MVRGLTCRAAAASVSGSSLRARFGKNVSRAALSWRPIDLRRVAALALCVMTAPERSCGH